MYLQNVLFPDLFLLDSLVQSQCCHGCQHECVCFSTCIRYVCGLTPMEMYSYIVVCTSMSHSTLKSLTFSLKVAARQPARGQSEGNGTQQLDASPNTPFSTLHSTWKHVWGKHAISSRKFIALLACVALSPDFLSALGMPLRYSGSVKIRMLITSTLQLGSLSYREAVWVIIAGWISAINQ